jgi:hypothetical protein
MHQYNPSTRSDPDSLAPVALERASVDDEVSKMRRGNTLPLALSLVASTIAAIAGIHWLGGIDRQQAYARAAEQLETIDAQQSEAFLRCALPNVQRSQLSSTQALHNAIEIVSERFDKFYARQLVHCSNYLDDLNNELNRVRVPADMQRGLTSLRQTAQGFGRAWDNYRLYLEDPTQRYDYVQAAPLIEKVTLAWADYRTQQIRIRAKLRAHD